MKQQSTKSTIRIDVTHSDESGLILSLDTVVKQLKEGYTSGADANETESYSYSLTHP